MPTPRLALVLPLLLAALANAQTAESSPAERGVKLAWENRCKEAMPLLEQAMTDTSLNNDARRPVAYAGVMCAMTLHEELEAVSYLAWLRRHYADDADVLFLATNVYLELSDRSQTALVKLAPASTQLVQLNAKNYERQGNFEKAIVEYRIVAEREPAKPGIHYRIGGLILASPETVDSREAARKEFEAELKVSPQAAGAEYYVGELYRQEGKLEDAISHYRKAIALHDDFAEAHYGLGRSLFDAGKTEDSVVPLERARTLDQNHPTYRFTLGSAYRRLGRKDDADREFEAQKRLAVSMNESKKALQRNIDGAAAPEVKP